MGRGGGGSNKFKLGVTELIDNYYSPLPVERFAELPMLIELQRSYTDPGFHYEFSLPFFFGIVRKRFNYCDYA